MSCPGFVDRVVAYVLKKGKGKIVANRQLIMLCEGSDQKWGQYLSGARAGAIIREANFVLREHNLELYSEGSHSERWRTITVAEANVRRAEMRLLRAPKTIRGAYRAMLDLVQDERTPKKLQQHGQAWIELFANDHSAACNKIFLDWSDEMIKALPAPKAGTG